MRLTPTSEAGPAKPAGKPEGADRGDAGRFVAALRRAETALAARREAGGGPEERAGPPKRRGEEPGEVPGIVPAAPVAGPSAAGALVAANGKSAPGASSPGSPIVSEAGQAGLADASGPGQAAARALMPSLAPRLPGHFVLTFPPNAWPLIRAEGFRGPKGLSLRLTAADAKDEARLKAAVAGLRDALEAAGHTVDAITVQTGGR